MFNFNFLSLSLGENSIAVITFKPYLQNKFVNVLILSFVVNIFHEHIKLIKK